MCFGGGGNVPSAPDTSAQQQGSSQIGQIASAAGQDQLNWAKGQVANNGAVTGNIQSQLNPLIGQQAGAGAAAANQFTNTTIPGLNNQLTTAQNYGNQAGMDLASANAQAGTAQAYNAARLNNQRQLGSYGVDPSQLKSGALNLNANLQQAGAVGNAGYQAGQQRQLAGMQMTSQALGQNLQAAGMGQGFYGGANATGNNIVGMGNQTTQVGSQALSAPSQMFQTGLSGYGTSANIANQNFQDRVASYAAQQQNANSFMSGVGNLTGAALKAYSQGGLADGGCAIPTRRYAGGGQISSMVPVQGATPIMAGASAPSDGGARQENENLLMRGAGDLIGGALAPRSPVDKANAQMQRDPDMQALQAGPRLMSPDEVQPVVGAMHADGGQTKRMDYGNPGVLPSRGVPPQVGIPGPWIAANGGPTPNAHGSEPGTFISQGASDGTGIDDQVPARVSVGEFVIPADVVHAKGKEFFDKLIQRYHTPAAQQRQQMGMHHAAV